jgi:hypothetical protein
MKNEEKLNMFTFILRNVIKYFSNLKPNQKSSFRGVNSQITSVSQKSIVFVSTLFISNETMQ